LTPTQIIWLLLGLGVLLAQHRQAQVLMAEILLLVWLPQLLLAVVVRLAMV
jgi:hypothetical protein